MADVNRPVTPPPKTMPTPLTPEQIRQFELNRLKAKQRQRQREEEISASSSLNSNRKRPIGVTPATSNSPTSSSQPLQRDSRLGTYFEYDLSKMVNSKGGFLVEDDKDADEEVRRKEKERERQRARQNQEPDIDHTYKNIFKCLICKRCQDEKPDKYSLLTKTECKEDYLLTDAELRDQELLPHLLKANPHKSTFANMMLFLRCQVEDFAWKKWGSPEELDAEYERRMAEKKRKKNKKFEQGLRDLRRRTKEGIWQRRKDEEHVHEFGPAERGDDGMTRQTCDDCGFMDDPSLNNQAEHEQISTALEVERLEVNLFRSKSLWMPTRARGVFGGQVISQALVSATYCVNPAYGLHCYFLTSASPATPIVYYVERLRQGRSYTSLCVKAVQNGSMIFILMCSFQKPEPWQPSHQWSMPDVPTPEECDLEEDHMLRDSNRDNMTARIKHILKLYADSPCAQERTKSPIAIKRAKEHEITSDGSTRYMYWMKAKNIPQYEPHFQKPRQPFLIIGPVYPRLSIGFILSCRELSISVAGRILGLTRYSKGPEALAMSSTIDHAIYFYESAHLSSLVTSDTVDCGDWLLYTMECPRAASGRGVMRGQIFTRGGTLVAVTTQEGVVRANIRGPAEEVKVPTKL
ncbi:thioesterase-like superfamily-domain-containing protein [Desarmillaria tabescens]|uniref:Thioesterase-like superfamily-domain-containing protein n=1 Tax=Armillaria tabescens TaxID=1929756 RepID=A0AA39NGN9_ARMTA|nr:thioesterase-like superfamily-domain-containing protein [Desarmillaria tabescens]KAK0465301.1 thioesterase-like superfamily-domain-containing protein [Desarmillaria tabescens]